MSEVTRGGSKSAIELANLVHSAGEGVLASPHYIRIHPGAHQHKKGETVTETVRHSLECSWFSDDTTCNCPLKALLE